MQKRLNVIKAKKLEAEEAERKGKQPPRDKCRNPAQKTEITKTPVLFMGHQFLQEELLSLIYDCVSTSIQSFAAASPLRGSSVGILPPLQWLSLDAVVLGFLGIVGDLTYFKKFFKIDIKLYSICLQNGVMAVF